MKLALAIDTISNLIDLFHLIDVNNFITYNGYKKIKDSSKKENDKNIFSFEMSRYSYIIEIDKETFEKISQLNFNEIHKMNIKEFFKKYNFEEQII